MVFTASDFLFELNESKQLQGVDSAKSLEHAQKALNMLQMGNSDELLSLKNQYYCELLHLAQMAMHQRGQYTEAYGAGLKALECETELTTLRAGILRYLATTLHNIGLVDNALEYCEEAYQIAEFTHDEYTQAEVLVAFGLIYEHFSNYEKQLEASKKALTIFERLGIKHRAAVVSNNIAHSYMKMNCLDEASKVLQNVVQTTGIAMNDVHTPALLVTLGELQILMGQHHEAIHSFKKAAKSATTMGRTRAVFYALYELAKVYLTQERSKAALNQVNLAQQLAEETNLLFETGLCHEFKSQYYRSRKKYREALEHLEKNQAIRDKIRGEKSVARTQVLMAIHETESMRHDAIVAKLKSETLEEMVRMRTEELQVTRDMTLQAIAALAETRDVETGNHIKRTALHVRAMVKLLNECGVYKVELNLEENRMLPQCAMLHDIGKVGVPDAILLKPDRFTPEEFEEMKKHTLYGYQALRYIEEESSPQTFLDLAALIAISHHERWDGSGYPNRLMGDKIPLPGRIMAIVDVYDALVSKRHYKEPYSHSYAIGVLKEERGRHFDPALVDVFVEHQEVFRAIAIEYADSDAEREILKH